MSTLSDSPITKATEQQLRDIRLSLLRLHKLLLDNERANYEKEHGKVSVNKMYQLVLHDEAFAWLRPISKIIVDIDILFDSDEGATQTAGEQLIKKIKALLKPAETGVDFERKYFEALQSDPDIILAHAAVTKLFPKEPPEELIN